MMGKYLAFLVQATHGQQRKGYTTELSVEYEIAECDTKVYLEKAV